MRHAERFNAVIELTRKLADASPGKTVQAPLGDLIHELRCALRALDAVEAPKSTEDASSSLIANANSINEGAEPEAIDEWTDEKCEHARGFWYRTVFEKEVLDAVKRRNARIRELESEVAQWVSYVQQADQQKAEYLGQIAKLREEVGRLKAKPYDPGF